MQSSYYGETDRDLKVRPICSSSHESNMLKISHQNTFYFLRYGHVRYVRNLFANIQEQ